MRAFIFALAAIVPAFAIDRAGAADELPAFDIARNCNEETAGAAIGGPAACSKDETDAKNQRHRKNNASARAASVARRATSNF
jgi:hypothetical protein